MAQTRPIKATMEYENLDMAPVYVENAQGLPTPQGALQIMFYSDYIKPVDRAHPVEARVVNPDPSRTAVDLKVGEDPYGISGGKVRIVRRIEANLVFSAKALKTLVPWLQQKIQELETR